MYRKFVFSSAFASILDFDVRFLPVLSNKIDISLLICKTRKKLEEKREEK